MIDNYGFFFVLNFLEPLALSISFVSLSQPILWPRGEGGRICGIIAPISTSKWWFLRLVFIFLVLWTVNRNFWFRRVASLDVVPCSARKQDELWVWQIWNVSSGVAFIRNYSMTLCSISTLSSGAKFYF